MTATYHPESSRAAERGVGSVKAIMKKTQDKGSNFKEAFAVFKNTCNKSVYWPNQRFFLRN